jgi:hypothetical protein
MSAGCTRLQQRNNNEPATVQPAAEAELTLGGERTKKTNWPTSGAQTSPGLMRSRTSVQDLWSGLGRAADPAVACSRGVEARRSRKHAGQVAALYYR